MALEPLWQPGQFLIAGLRGPEKVNGYIYRSLGMWRAPRFVDRRKRYLEHFRQSTWSLTHLGSGHSICHIVAPMQDAFEVATEFADATDWDFDSLGGWRDRDPDLPDKVCTLLDKHARIIYRTKGESSEAIARQIAEVRD